MPYFDWNATAPLHPDARAAWLEASDAAWANPSAAYREGRQARLALDGAREELAGLLGVEPGQVIFTSGATEANNAFIRGLAKASPGKEIWVSSIEHPSVREAAMLYGATGRVRQIPVSAAGIIDLDWIREQLGGTAPCMVSVMAANNETGVIQPWEALRDLCAEAGVPCHCDAVQWVGKLPSPVGTGYAGVTFSGHKFGGPKGIGCLILGTEWSGLKLQVGGAQEMNSRAGTENIPSILAMVAALKARVTTDFSAARFSARDRFEAALRQQWEGEIIIHGAGADRLWNACFVSLPEFRAERWIARLDGLGFQISAGSACATGKTGTSPVLAAMGIEEATARRTVRISSGWETSSADWEALLAALTEARELLSSDPESSGPGNVIEI
jgi:cysteine desulfurase